MRAIDIKQVVEVAPHIPFLAGAGARHSRDVAAAEGLDDPDAEASPVRSTSLGKIVDI